MAAPIIPAPISPIASSGAASGATGEPAGSFANTNIAVAGKIKPARAAQSQAQIGDHGGCFSNVDIITLCLTKPSPKVEPRTRSGVCSYFDHGYANRAASSPDVLKRLKRSRAITPCKRGWSACLAVGHRGEWRSRATRCGSERIPVPRVFHKRPAKCEQMRTRCPSFQYRRVSQSIIAQDRRIPQKAKIAIGLADVVREMRAQSQRPRGANCNRLQTGNNLKNSPAWLSLRRRLRSNWGGHFQQKSRAPRAPIARAEHLAAGLW